MNTPDNLHGVTKEDWFDYESLRRSGRMNMWGARPYLGLTKVEFGAILKYYSEMSKAWVTEFEEKP